MGQSGASGELHRQLDKNSIQFYQLIKSAKLYAYLYYIRVTLAETISFCRTSE